MVSQTKMLHVNGAEIHLWDTGKGFPIVLVHAGIAHSGMWDDQIPFLAEKFRVITYDMRGFGKSLSVPGEYAHYQDLISILDQLKIESCVLVGCSKGGGVILDVALSIPARVAGLVVVAGMADGLEMEDEPEPPPQWEEAIKAFREGDLQKTNELEMQIWVDGCNQPVGRADKKLRDKVRKMNEIVLKNEFALTGVTEKVLEPNAGTRLREISAPTLLISGSLDDPYITQALDKMANEIPEASHEMIRDTAHLPNMEKPKEFNALIHGFFQKNNLF